MKKHSYLCGSLLLLALTIPSLAGVAGKSASTDTTRSALYGYMGYSDKDDFCAGLYSLDRPDYSLKWDDPIYADATVALQTGWLKDNRICGFIPYYYQAKLITVLYVEMNLDNGIPYIIADSDINEGAYEICAYNSSDRYIYGYGFDSSGDWLFMKSPADNPFSIEIVKRLTTKAEEAEVCSAMTYNPKTKSLYGVNSNNEFVSITPSGTQHKIMDLDQYAQQYISGLCYATREDKFYWNANIKAPGYLNEVSYLYTIDPIKMTATEVDEYENDEQFMFIVTTDSDYNPECPGAAEVISNSFAEGSLTGNVTFRLPSTRVDGTDIASDISWEATLDGTVISSGSGAAGSEVTIELTELAEGMHYIALTPSVNGRTGESGYFEIFAGFDTPATPQNVSLTSTSVNWDAVTLGANGGYINASEVTYNVYINDAFEGSTSGTSLAVNIPTNLSLKRYVARVEAVWNNKSSKSGYSNALIEGQPLKLDVTLKPTIEQYSLMQTYDANGDGYTWSYDEDESALYSDYCEDEPMDDWIFMPVMDFPDPDFYYTLSLDAKCGSDSYPNEYFEVKLGNAPTRSAMTEEIMERTKVSADGYATYSSQFSIPEAMQGYIGIHAVSNADQYGMYVKNICVNKTDISVSGVKTISNNKLRIRAVSGGIIVSGGIGENVRIYSSSGILMRSFTTTAEEERIEIPAGLYIINREKIIVK